MKDNIVMAIGGGGVEYTVIPPWGRAIPKGVIVTEGDIYEDGAFRAPTDDEVISRYRPGFNKQREVLFNETAWVRQRHNDYIELLIKDEETWDDWLAYWQDLRDMPNEPGFDPSNPNWPEQPE